MFGLQKSVGQGMSTRRCEPAADCIAFKPAAVPATLLFAEKRRPGDVNQAIASLQMGQQALAGQLHAVVMSLLRNMVGWQGVSVGGCLSGALLKQGVSSCRCCAKRWAGWDMGWGDKAVGCKQLSPPSSMVRRQEDVGLGWPTTVVAATQSGPCHAVSCSHLHLLAASLTTHFLPSRTRARPCSTGWRPRWTGACGFHWHQAGEHWTFGCSSCCRAPLCLQRPGLHQHGGHPAPGGHFV